MSQTSCASFTVDGTLECRPVSIRRHTPHERRVPQMLRFPGLPHYLSSTSRGFRISVVHSGGFQGWLLKLADWPIIWLLGWLRDILKVGGRISS